MQTLCKRVYVVFFFFCVPPFTEVVQQFCWFILFFYFEMNGMYDLFKSLPFGQPHFAFKSWWSVCRNFVCPNNGIAAFLMCAQMIMHANADVVFVGVSFFLTWKDFGRMFDNSFPACAFFFFFEVEINLRMLIPLSMPGSVHSGSVSWDDFWIGSYTMPAELHSQLTPTLLVQGCMRV